MKDLVPGWQAFSLYTGIIIGPVVLLGAIANLFSLSHFLQHRDDSLGKKFLVYLNIADSLVCSVGIMVYVLPLFNTLSHKLFLLGIIGTFAVFGLGGDATRIITTYLCVIRTVMVVSPLHRPNTRVIRGTVVVVVVLFLGFWIANTAMFAVPMARLFGECFDDHHSCRQDDFYTMLNEHSFGAKVASVFAFLPLIIVLVTSVVSIYHLLRRDDALNQRDVSNSNQRAAHTVLFLALIFLISNGLALGIMIYLQRRISQEHTHDDFPFGFMIANLVILQLVPLNSALNPLVYITRTAELRGRVGRGVRRVGVFVRGVGRLLVRGEDRRVRPG